MFYFAMIILKLIGYFLSFFPRKVFLTLGYFLGEALRFFQFRIKVIEGNLQIAFPDWSEQKKQKFIVKIYRNLGVLFLELLGSFYCFDRFIEKYADLEGEENLLEALAMKKGVLVMTAHLGNWEVLTFSGPVKFSTNVTMVTKELKPAWFHRIVDITRSLLGVRMACEPKTMKAILQALKKEEIVGFVMDQYAGAPVGARVPFFGKPVGSHTALAALALRTEVPVVPAIAYRCENGRYKIRFEKAFTLEKDEDQNIAILKNTAKYVAHTEGWIKEIPEQWMWIHRRWKGDLSPLPPHSFGEMLR